MKTIDNAGNASAASTAKVVIYDVIAPPVPGGFTAPAATKVKPTLTFTAATDTGGAGTDHYNVYRDGVLLGAAPHDFVHARPRRRTPRALLLRRERRRQGRQRGSADDAEGGRLRHDRPRSPRPRRPRRRRVSKVKPAISWTRPTDPAALASPRTPCTATAPRSPPRRSARAIRTRRRRQRHLRLRHPRRTTRPATHPASPPPCPSSTTRLRRRFPSASTARRRPGRTRR